ncbi:MAG: ABC transporter substrate-binding protein [Ruminococcus sp.]|nr:ABC transporter substrate-binding protein [Oscillospiraceae bacterium]MDY4413406.1 ABC transporter substrate-binding protein [Ruminococcus sp.]
MKKIKMLSAVGIFLMILTACNNQKEQILSNQKSIGNMELKYAEQFSVEYYENDISLVNIKDGRQYIIVPEDEEIPEGFPDSATVIKQPVENIYISASSSVDLFNGINSLDSIYAVSTAKKDWSLPYIQNAMDSGKILYAGKYSSPDYEMLLSGKCGLAVESTMIYHSPEIMELLESQGIPVIVERSSYEPHPLGRMEWIKLYGLILGKEKEAEEFFNEKSAVVENIESFGNTGKTAVFFYITSNGSVNVRKTGDYISKMIELAGGNYILNAESLNVEENALSTINMQFEAFYSLAKDTDYLIYNSTVDGQLDTLDQLIEKNSLLADFKAVQNGDVWCTDKNMFQQTTATAEVISDFNKIFSESTEDTEFIYHLS